jgi:hypothetical protein
MLQGRGVAGKGGETERWNQRSWFIQASTYWTKPLHERF